MFSDYFTDLRLFSKSLLDGIGRYDQSCIGEDLDVGIRLNKYCEENDLPCKIGFSLAR